MSEQILKNLQIKLSEELGGYNVVDANIKINKVKEILQYYVLNFVYHHPEYSKWVMYGGSALRIIHGLDRMSVDLDFEVAHEVTEEFLAGLKKEVNDYFSNTYGTKDDFLNITIKYRRGLVLKFNVGKELGLGGASNLVHVKIDLNNFIAPKTVIEHRPINRDQFSFVILTYNMGALMASKLAAVFLRGNRGVGNEIYEEKGRDIYDLLWYMEKKIVPDFDYLNAKLRENNAEVPDIKTLFSRLALKMNKVSQKNLENDLLNLFIERDYINNWLQSWLDSYFRLVEGYEINTIIGLANGKSIQIFQHFQTDNFSFTYTYQAEEGGVVKIRYIISDYWIDFEKDLLVKTDKNLADKIEFGGDGWSSNPPSSDKLKQYATLFYQKTENYLKKTHQIVLGQGIITKVIRLTADNFNPKEQIVLDKSSLSACELDDLLR
ncbi:MAG: nucleotidyl transferase AbiEii/AbiGii toxin family protein [Patescibacteria group bacterium]